MDMIWYFIIVAILILTIAFNVRTFRCFCKSGFVKTITGIMGILLTIIGIFVGIFADNLSQHSKAYSNRYWFSPGTIISFPIEQLKYHALQTDSLEVLLHDTLILKDVVDTLVLKRDINAVKYIFVVDKTASGKPDNKLQWENLRKEIKKDLKAKGCKNADLIDKKVWVKNEVCFKYREDLMLAACINAICKDNVEANTPECQIFIYNGENDSSDTGKFTSTINLGRSKGNIDTFLKEYKFIEEKPKTNFKSIIDEISKSHLLKNQDQKTIITIFSDFLHEDTSTNVSFRELEGTIENLKNIIKADNKSKEPSVLLNLVVLNGSESEKTTKHKIDTITSNGQFSHKFDTIRDRMNMKFSSANINPDTINNFTFNHKIQPINYSRNISINSKDTVNIVHRISITAPNDTVDKKDKIEQTLNLFRRHFHFEYKNNYKEFQMLESNVSGIMTHLTAFIRKDKFYYKKLNQKDSISNLTFYYPFSIGKMEQIHSSLIKFEIDDSILNKSSNIKSLINVSDNSVTPSNFIFRLINIESNKEINLSKNDDLKEFSIDTINLYSADMDLDKIPTNMVLNISVQDTVSKYIIKEQIPIQFKTLLPKVLCYIMIIFITLFCVLLVTLIIYFCFKLAICKYACTHCS